MKPLTNKNGDVRELTKEDMKRFRPMKEVFPELANAKNITVKALGRPKKENPKQAISIRLDADVVSYFKNSGKGWQSKINEVLKSNIC